MFYSAWFIMCLCILNSFIYLHVFSTKPVSAAASVFGYLLDGVYTAPSPNVIISLYLYMHVSMVMYMQCVHMYVHMHMHTYVFLKGCAITQLTNTYFSKCVTNQFRRSVVFQPLIWQGACWRRKIVDSMQTTRSFAK